MVYRNKIEHILKYYPHLSAYYNLSLRPASNVDRVCVLITYIGCLYSGCGFLALYACVGWIYIYSIV